MRRVGLAIAAAACAAAAIVASCTIFDGLDDRVIEGGVEAGDAQTSDGPLLPGQQAGFFSLADAVAFCSNVFACPNLQPSVEISVAVPIDSNTFSSCVDWVTGPLPKDRNGVNQTAAQLLCAAKATTCQQAGACFWDDVIDSTDPRCAGKDAGKAGSCGDDGGAVYFCNSNAAIVHCANSYFASGSTCLYDDGGLPWCNRLPCGGQQCNGDLLEYCAVDGLNFSQNCALGGYTCGLDPTESYDDCLTNGAAKRCTSLAVSCAGATLTICDSQYQSNYDCATYGGACDSTGFPRCTRPNENCTPLDPDVDVCTGNVISLCVNGEKTTFDCSTIGKTCVAGASGQSGHCQ